MQLVLVPAIQAALIFYESFDDLDTIAANEGTVYGDISFSEHSCGGYANLTTNSYISYPLEGNFDRKSLTIEFWIKNTLGHGGGFFDIGRLYGEHPNSMGIFGGFISIWGEVRDETTHMVQELTPGEFIGYQWNHIAVTFTDYNPSTNCFKLRVYHNGKAFNYPPTVCNFYPNMSSDMWIGRNYYYGYANSYIDEFRASL